MKRTICFWSEKWFVVRIESKKCKQANQKKNAINERNETRERKCNKIFYRSVTEGNTDTTFFTNTKFKSIHLYNIYWRICYRKWRMRKSYSFRIVIEFILLVLHCLHSFNVNWAFVSVVYISLLCFSMLQCLLVFCCMFLSSLFIKEFPKCINLKWHWFQLKRMQLCYIVCAANCHRNDLLDCRLTNRTFCFGKMISEHWIMSPIIHIEFQNI